MLSSLTVLTNKGLFMSIEKIEKIAYTVSFDKNEEQTFKNILACFDNGQYCEVLSEISTVNDNKQKDRMQCILSLALEAAVIIRFHMKSARVAKVLTKEEQAAKDAEEAKNHIRINVYMPKEAKTRLNIEAIVEECTDKRFTKPWPLIDTEMLVAEVAKKCIEFVGCESALQHSIACYIKDHFGIKD